MDDVTARKKFYEFIRARNQGVIATAGPDGKPEAALMNIAVTPELDIIFETTDATRKFANLKADSRVSFVIGWDGGETLQYDGMADEPEGRAFDEARRLFLATFPQKTSHQNWPGNHYFWVRPLWVRFSNYNPPRTVEEFRFGTEEPSSARGPWWRLFRGETRQQRN
jgi:uncharacterized pyridoxamine 5'-phosphate oxidase family protein